MSPRALWKGTLKGPDGFRCGVALHSALSSAEKVSFHIVNRKTGHRVERRFTDEETGAFVEREQQVRGFELDDGNYVLLEPETLEALVPESDKTISVKEFLPCDEVDRLYFDKPYYLAPADADDGELFRAFAEALRRTSTAAVGQAVLFRRQRALLIRAHTDTLIAATLKYDYEVRSVRTAFQKLSLPEYDEELLDLAGHLIDSKTGRFEPEKFHDRYNDALLELIRLKNEGRKLPAREHEPEQKVVDLREAFRRSVDAADGQRRRAHHSRSGKKAGRSS